jgi:hypothetical protein
MEPDYSRPCNAIFYGVAKAVRECDKNIDLKYFFSNLVLSNTDTIYDKFRLENMIEED